MTARKEGDGVSAAAYYPKAGLFMLGERLFNVRRFADMEGHHFWETVVQYPMENVERIVIFNQRRKVYVMDLAVTGPEVVNHPLGLIHPVVVSTTPMYTVMDEKKGILAIDYVRRIQRVVRDFLQRMRVGRSLAVAMGWHARLGGGALIAVLPKELGPILVR